MKIGLRTIKTGIAVSLAMFISTIFNINAPFYSGIAAVIAMQPTVSDSWKKGLHRVLGTFVGAIMGIILSFLLPSNFITLGLGIVILIYILNKLNWQDSISIGCVVFIGIFISTDAGIISRSTDRLLETTIGIVIALVVNYLIYPPTYDAKIVKEIDAMSDHIWTFTANVIELILDRSEEGLLKLNEEIEEIDKIINESNKFLKLQLKEDKVLIYGNISSQELNKMIVAVEDINQNLLNMNKVLEKGIKTEVVELVEIEFNNIKKALRDLKKKDVLITEERVQTHEDIQQLIGYIKSAKSRLKFSDEINNYPTDEVVKILVILYNLEDILNRFKRIKGY
ncbi:aromatic acid exporter family protein [Serpentinicella sp. ANB-PHB4]|uniref:FUSC family protein n=1 Tax=Serpentinicella sp. ANB-PHB4 TaxID=3074076 RepID=UPI002864C587|nr:aromatic acid exporter family protein [Serpentinicella sp. ANB-PHB4]MDR5658883.1 aromatic acid exporter family protein [Serpentinicella sp. ANB-PHB4]